MIENTVLQFNFLLHTYMRLLMFKAGNLHDKIWKYQSIVWWIIKTYLLFGYILDFVLKKSVHTWYTLATFTGYKIECMNNKRKTNI